MAQIKNLGKAVKLEKWQFLWQSYKASLDWQYI